MDNAEIKRLVTEAGAVGVGVVTLGPVDDVAEGLYQTWLAQGKHGEMAYLERYADVRHDPRLLLDGAKSMIVAAFSYYNDDNTTQRQTPLLPEAEGLTHTRAEARGPEQTPSLPVEEGLTHGRAEARDRGQTPSLPVEEGLTHGRAEARDRGQMPPLPVEEGLTHVRAEARDRGQTPSLPVEEGLTHWRAEARGRGQTPPLLGGTNGAGHDSLGQGEAGLDALGHDSLGHDALGHDALGHDGSGLRWARYALGRDYHEEIRERLGAVAEAISRSTGALCRVTVDTAPLRERYWAVKAGVGFLGINNQLIVPGAGSWCVLGEIVTTLDIEPDAPCEDTCLGCGRCVRACPGGALDGRGGMDARRCMSYLSIEKKDGPADKVPDFGDRIYGCDVCQEVCPHNVGARVTEIANFKPREAIVNLSREDILNMEQSDFSRIFSHSAIKRAKLAGLQRNARGGGKGE